MNMDKLTLTKIVALLVASVYLAVYSVFFSTFYSLIQTNWFVYSKVFAVTLATAIVIVVWLPADWALHKIIS